MKLPTLFKKTSTGADQMWEIRTSGNVIFTRFGQVGGKIQETQDLVKTGKNQGRANATTPKEQAEAEAKSQWEKKLKKGYVQSLDDARAGKVDPIIEGGYFPMLAHRYDEHGDDITFPAFLQPKLDGHRCTADVIPDDATLWTRTRKPISSMPHIAQALVRLFAHVGGRVLPDGELYNHKYHNRFEELTHFIRSSQPKPGYEVLQYHIYDVNMPGTFEERYYWLTQAWLRTHYREADPFNATLHLVETIAVNNEEEMMTAFERFNSQGYEGAIVRNAHGKYVGKRSVDLQKLKTFIDAEFKVVAVVEGRGKLAGHALFSCLLPDKKGTFDVKMRGPLEQLKTYWENPKSVIGKDLTVKFQGFTKYGKPRFPVGWRFAEKL